MGKGVLRGTDGQACGHMNDSAGLFSLPVCSVLLTPGFLPALQVRGSLPPGTPGLAAYRSPREKGSLPSGRSPTLQADSPLFQPFSGLEDRAARRPEGWKRGLNKGSSYTGGSQQKAGRMRYRRAILLLCTGSAVLFPGLVEARLSMRR